MSPSSFFINSLCFLSLLFASASGTFFGLPGFPPLPPLPGFPFGGNNGWGLPFGQQPQAQAQAQAQVQAQPQQSQPQQQQQQQQPQPVVGEFVETNFKGSWELASPDSGVSAMHMQLMPNGKLVIFDATSLGKSNIRMQNGNCRLGDDGRHDCYAHSVEYDPETNKVRTLTVTKDPWCSSGGLTPDGTLVGTGGWKEGEKITRYISPCATCDWRESAPVLSDVRWYATQSMQPDGRFVLFGGRRAFNYEYLAPEGQASPGKVDLPFLFETTDIFENNLYPFVHLAPNGNLFIFANNKSILFDVQNNKIVRTYPVLPGGARNYPGSGTSAILPIDLRGGNNNNIDIEVLICGGGQPEAFGKAEKEKIFLPALNSCGRIRVLDPNSQWELDHMPSPRLMGDMLNLPNGKIMIHNGAQKGASGWQFADEPNLTPVLYSYDKPLGNRFKKLKPSQIPRMYHSSSAVLPDGRVLVAGSNTNPVYQFTVKYPTEVRVEKFSPPYLDPELDTIRPVLSTNLVKSVGYKGAISLGFTTSDTVTVEQRNVMVTLYKPPFTTHGYSMNQRLLILPITVFNKGAFGEYIVQAEAPATGELAPPGYYLLFVVYKGVPSAGTWIHLQ